MNKFTYTLISIFIVVVFGCTKYEDGPLISLRSKKNRVAHNIGKQWRSDKYTLQMGQEGYALQISGVEGEVDIGDWTFSDTKEELLFVSSWDEEDFPDYQFRILQLKHKKLKLEGAFPFDSSSQVHEFELHKIVEKIK